MRCEPAATYRCSSAPSRLFTVGGVALAVISVVLVIAQT